MHANLTGRPVGRHHGGGIERRAGSATRTMLPGNALVAIVPGNPHFAAVGLPFVGNVAGRLDIVSLGLNYRWDEAPPARAY